MRVPSDYPQVFESHAILPKSATERVQSAGLVRNSAWPIHPPTPPHKMQQSMELRLRSLHLAGYCASLAQFELQRNIAFKQPVLLCQAAEPPQCFKPVVDGRRFQCLDVNEVLPAVDQVTHRELRETGNKAVGRTEPAEELLQIVAVAAHPRGREIIAPQTTDEIGKPAIR